MTTPTVEVLTIGESMGLFFPPAMMPLSSRPPFHLSFGGAESNVAIGLARLGHTVRWLGRLGDDEVGRFIDHELRAEGVQTPGLFGPGHTGLMVRTPMGFGRTSVQYSRSGSAGSQLTAADIDTAAVQSAGMLHLTGITAALGAEPFHALLVAAQSAREAGVTVSLDLNYRSSLWSRAEAQPALRELVQLASVVFATADEAAVLLGAETASQHSDHKLAQDIAALGPSEVILKRGASGAISLTAEGEFVQQLTEVDERDPVGAGDAFAAGYLHGMLSNMSAQERLDFAGCVAAHSVTVVGDWEGLPRLDDLSQDGRDIVR